MSLSNFTDTVDEIQLAGVIARNNLKNIIHKFTKNSIGTTLRTCWNGSGDYPFPTVGSVLSVASDNAADDIGGTGALTLLIVGLDENFLAIEETVILTGLTPVLTVLLFARITNATVKKVGSGEKAAGAISVTHVTDGNVIAITDGSRGRTMQAVYTVPADKIGLLLRADASTGMGKLVTIELYQRDWDTATLDYDGFAIRHISDVFEGVYLLDLKVPLPIPPRTDIDMRCVSAVASEVSISFDIFLIDAS